MASLGGQKFTKKVVSQRAIMHSWPKRLFLVVYSYAYQKLIEIQHFLLLQASRLGLVVLSTVTQAWERFFY